VALAPEDVAALAEWVKVETRVAGADLVGPGAELVLGRMLGRMGPVPVAVALGPGGAATPIRLARLLGAEVLVVTRGARGLGPDAAPAELGSIEDHLSLWVPNPLVGPNVDELGTRFPDMAVPYDPALRALALEEARGTGGALASGVYAAHPDPSRATPAECSMLRRLGADWIGKGGVPEVIVARHAGMRVLGLVAVAGGEARLADLTRRVVARIG
jgi:purine-nucleoside phosphorylase